jgi:hypothetical protein
LICVKGVASIDVNNTCHGPPILMSDPANNRKRHRTVFTVLLAWVFALGVSWANGCQFQQHGNQVHQVSGSAFLNAGAQVASMGHLGGDSGHDGDPGDGADSCLKVFDEGANAIVKLASSLDPSLAVIGPPMLFEWASKWAASTPVDTMPEMPVPSPHLPLRTRFSRLTL